MSRPRKHPPGAVRVAVEMYRDGETCQAIEEATGLQRGVLYYHLRKGDVPINRMPTRRNNWPELVERVRNGESAHSVALEAGCCVKNLRRHVEQGYVQRLVRVWRKR